MKQISILKNANFNEKKVVAEPILETPFSKEIRILMKEGQQMKEHKTPFPIIVEIFEGAIDFGVNGEILNLAKGDLITLEGNIPHNLIALKDSIVRLTLSKSDKYERVEDVIKN